MIEVNQSSRLRIPYEGSTHVLRVRLAAVTVLATSLLLAGCGGGGSDASPDPGGTSSEAVVPATWPLTGLPAEGDDATQKHPVLVAKIDNSYDSAPQIGLSHADLVVEELVEGGITRLAPFFYSDLPTEVGPIRSMRASDIGIVPDGATVVTSGAAAVTFRRIEKAGIPYIREREEGFSRDDSRVAPHNLFADIAALATTIKQQAARPADYLPWGDDAGFPGGRAATRIDAQFSGAHTTEWSFRDGHYVNTNSNAAKGDQFLADSILVLRVRLVDAGYLDPAGNHVPESVLEGTGQALLFHNGELVRGTWRKDDLRGALQLSTESGPLTVPAGHVWIELVPAKDGEVSFK